MEEKLKEFLEAMRQENAAAHAETRRQAETLAAEGRHLFNVVGESLSGKIELVAEGVGAINEKLDREDADIRREMREGFAETYALIRFSHAELDRRISTTADASKAR
jgi:hypothetical protein